MLFDAIAQLPGGKWSAYCTKALECAIHVNPISKEQEMKDFAEAVACTTKTHPPLVEITGPDDPNKGPCMDLILVQKA
jgi:hypothetical protein